MIGVVVAGAVVIAGIGFAGSYAAVRELAEKKGFGGFSVIFPIGIDAGICVLLALDLLLTWIRIPFPLLRQTAWLLTAATIAFNGAAAWPDPLGVGMHAVIPVLFVVAVEAARHAVGRIADITADKHMEGVRLTRWLLSPVPTFKLWRRMKLWELRSYEQVIKLEQDRLIYQARLQARFGRNWRRKAPVESLMPLRLARFGVPLAETAPAGLAAAGIEPALLSPKSVPAQATEHPRELTGHQQPQHAAPQQRPLLGPTTEETSGNEQTPVAAQENQTLPEDYLEPLRAYIAQYGIFPTGHQFGYYLMDAFGVTAPDGSPLSEAALGSVLLDLQQTGEWTIDPSVITDGGIADEHDRGSDPSVIDGESADARDVVTGPIGHDSEHPFFGPPATTASSPAAEPMPAQAEAAPVASSAATVPTRAMLDQAPEGSVTASATAPTVWEASVTDTGEATARVPEQQLAEADKEAEEEHRIQQVVTWLIEAEEANEKLSGAEAARRNGVSPSTGQRDMRKAKARFQELQREQGRTRLHSVRTP
ncbi:DUF2637 domain-containing protein [Streptomyces sp. NPDC058268]|uniref:DUF2637 domain-containing protein n=1 Tax=Streptomyces sp. NPDC058268 TaxID=3346413 RepID=UPI0036E2C7DC